MTRPRNSSLASVSQAQKIQHRLPSQIVRIAFLIILCLLSATVGRAQKTTATVLGTVRDTSGADISGARVTATNVQTGLIRIGQTNDTGEYTIASLPAGIYSLKVEKTGFEAATRPNITVVVGQELRADFALHLGSVATTVVVHEQPEMTQTVDASIGNVLDEIRVLELPLNGRQYSQLALLSTGVTVDGAAQGLASGMEQGGTRVSINGSRTYDVNYTLDSFSITDYTFTNLGGYPPLDSVQEFKVVTGLYDASSGYKSGGQVNAIIKSGTNALHGSVYEFFRNAALDARNFFDPLKIPPYRQNQYGFSLGGPIELGHLYHGKDHSFFFVSYEGLRIGQSKTGLYSVPTMDMRNGDLSAFGKTITNPFTGQPFQNATIPTAMIDPVSAQVLTYAPPPNLPGVSNNLLSTALRVRNDDTLVVRLDHSSSRNRAFFRFLFANIDDFDPTPNGQLPGFGLSTITESRNGVFGLTTVVSPSLVNDLHVGLDYISGGQFVQNSNKNFVGILGLRGVSTAPSDYGFPLFTISEFSDIGDNAVPFSRSQMLYEVDDNLTWAKGSHTFTFGGDISYLRWLPDSQESNRGHFTYNGIFTGSGFADFLLGYPFLGLGTSGSTNGDYRSHGFSAYVTDAWRVRPHFTLSLGLRYEYNAPIASARDRWSNLYFNDSSNQGILLLASSGNNQVDSGEFIVPLSTLPVPVETSQQFGIPRSLVYPDRNNFGPRVGLAWSPFGDWKTMVRAGYGIFYSARTLGAWVAPAFNPPFASFKIAVNPQPNLQTADLMTASFAAFSALPYNIHARTGYVQQWGLDFQKQLSPNLLLDIGYVGSKGTKLEMAESHNQAYPGTTPAPTRRPNPNLPDLFTYGDNVGNSSYNALQFQIQKRLGHGITFTGNYTFSKSLDIDSSGVEGTSTGGYGPQDVRNLRAEWGPSSFDRRHNLTFDAVYDLPFGKGKAVPVSSGFLNAVLGDWQLSGIFTYYSGYRFTAQELQDVAGMARFGGSARPDVIGDPNLPYDQRTPQQWFNTSAFVLQPAGTFGNEGRGMLIGPDLIDTDLSLAKYFRIYRESSLQFRAEFFNAFNRTNFGQPNLSLGSASFGAISSAKNSRLVQFALKFIF